MVRHEDNRVSIPFSSDGFDDLRRIRTGAGDVALGLYLSGTVYVGHDRVIREFLLDQAHIGARDRGGERTARAGIRNKDGLFRREDLRGLGHEVHSGLHDDIGIHIGSFTGQLEAVTTEIADKLEDVRRHVIVRQDDGVLLFLEPIDCRHEGRNGWPFHRSDEILYQRVQVIGLHFHRVIIDEAARFSGRSAAQRSWRGAAGAGINKTCHVVLLRSRPTYARSEYNMGRKPRVSRGSAFKRPQTGGSCDSSLKLLRSLSKRGVALSASSGKFKHA